MQLEIEQNTFYKLKLTPRQAYELKALLQNYPGINGEEDTNIREVVYNTLPSFNELENLLR